MFTTKALTAQLLTQQYQPPSDTRTTPSMVWYRGRGHVVCGSVYMFMYGSSYVRISLCSLGVFLVIVCIEMN